MTQRDLRRRQRSQGRDGLVGTGAVDLGKELVSSVGGLDRDIIGSESIDLGCRGRCMAVRMFGGEFGGHWLLREAGDKWEDC